MKTGVLVHGCHLGALNWRGIMWGTPPYAMGRIPKAVSVALQEDASLMVFGTGASEKDGRKEGEYTLKYMLDHFLELGAFSGFEGVDLDEAKLKLAAISIPECRSLNTREEMEEGARIFLEQDVERMILVSSPTHISRCIRDALVVLHDPQLAGLRRHLYAAASDTSYLGGRVEDVVIFEPPHRGDQQAFLTHYVVNRIFKIPESDMPSFLQDLDVLLTKYRA
ncbi:YdcF family protein [Acidobacteriota bacterium]